MAVSDRSALSALSDPRRAGQRVAASLTAAAAQQDAVIAALEQWLGQLDRWQSYGRFHREVAQLLREQEELTRRTAEVGRRTLAQDLRDLGPQDAAELKIAADGQVELARRLDRALQEMEQAAGQLRPGDPVAADTIADALDQARRSAVAAEMRTTGAEIGQNQIGQAAAGQKQIVQDLQEVLDILANRQAEAARLVKRLRQLEGDLSALEERQAELRKQIDSVARPPSAVRQNEEARRELERLAGEQQVLRQEAQRLARQLERLQSATAAAAAGRAAEQMDQAGQCAAAGDRAGASGRAAEARQSLAEARRQLADRVRQAAAELAFEQMARLDDAIKHLRGQQQNALEEANRLWELERSQGNLSRAQAASVGDLARLQHALRGDTARLAKQLAGAGAFQLALGGAAGEMQDAAASLDRHQTGPPTQEPQLRALRQLDLVVEAIKPEPPAAEEAGGGPGGKGGPQAMPASGIPPVAELKLLRLLQADINSRTEKLQQAVTAAGKPTEEQTRQYNELSRRQARLADIIEQSRRELGAAAEKEDEDPLAQIARQMRESQQRIGRADSGDATQQLQRQIIEELDRLIRQARQKAGQCQPGAGQPQPAAPPAPTGQMPGKPGAAGQKPGNRPAAANSSRPPGDGRIQKAGLERTRSMMKQLWGELPEHVRQQMLQLPDEEFPPKYELLIEDYFRRLSEEKQP